MKIQLDDNELIVSNFEHLPDYYIGNLEFMGFVKKAVSNEYVQQTDSPLEVLIELIEFLNDIETDFSLCDSCKRILKKHNEKESQFAELKSKATKFKKGELGKTQVGKFYNEVRNLLSEDRKLKDHQIKAAYHLYNLKNGANFSVPGSGKTSVVLSVYEKLKNEQKVNTLFVVGPLACFGPWKNEFELTLGRVPNYSILAGGQQHNRKLHYYTNVESKSELYLTSFQTLLYDQDEVEVLFKNDSIKIYLVIDEAHYIKRLEGEWAKAVLRLSRLAKYRCVLTGTPMPKSYTDSFNLFDFLWPENQSIDRDSRARIEYLEEIRDYESASNLLLDKVYPLFYRVRKSDLNLEKQEFHPPILVEMNQYEGLIYDAIRTRIEKYPKDSYARNIEFISRLYKGRIIRLRQTLSYTGLLKTAIDGYDEDLLAQDSDLKEIITNYDELETPRKIEFLIDKVRKLNSQNRKVVIWAHFIGTLHLIYHHLKEEGFYCKIIYGVVPVEREAKSNEETREKIRDEFVSQESGLNILIANPGACSESISLHKTCQDAIYYDLSYNCAQYLQSLDRIHRVGGSEKKAANYYFLQYQDTLENDILSNVQTKAKKMFSVIEQDFKIYSLDMFEDESEDIDAYERLFGKGEEQ